MFRGLTVTKSDDGVVSASIGQLDDSFLPEEGEVTIKVHYAGLNYKDGLCLNGLGALIRDYPRIPGVECAGEVLESRDDRYKPGDKVVMTGWRFGEIWHGGFAEKAKVKADWLVPLADGLSLRQSMILGTAALTAILGLQALEKCGITKDSGEVLVTGAAGGVGSLSILLLAAHGYEVAAVSGRIKEAGAYLTALGAQTLVPRAELAEPAKKPLESARWAGCIDNVGGPMLGRIIGQLKYGGTVASIGNAGGNDLPASILPFLLRGVNVLGIDSVFQPYQSCVNGWNRLVAEFPLDRLEEMATEITLDELSEAGKKILEGQTKGRWIIAL